MSVCECECVCVCSHGAPRVRDASLPASFHTHRPVSTLDNQRAVDGFKLEFSSALLQLHRSNDDHLLAGPRSKRELYLALDFTHAEDLSATPRVIARDAHVVDVLVAPSDRAETPGPSLSWAAARPCTRT